MSLRWVVLLPMCWSAISYGQALGRADTYLRSKAAEGSFRGSVLVGIDGKVAFEKGYGFADKEWGALNSPTTRFRIASLTKQFTAACILLLEERGLLHVSDPVSKYLSDLPEVWRTITLHQLLTHTSGIPNYAAFPEMKQISRTGATPREMIELAAKRPPEFTPGTKWAYTNTGYVLLGMVVEKVSAKSYADFLAENIFRPLGMVNSGYDNPSQILRDRASGYYIRDGRITNAEFIDMSVPYAAGGIYSTVEDMFRWNEAVVHGKLLSPASMKQMFAEYPETSVADSHYGYGVVLTTRFGRALHYHGGGVQGFESVIQRYPNERLCIVVLSNLDPSRPWDLADHIAAEIFGQAFSTR